MSEKTVPAAGRFSVSRRAILAGTGVLATGLAVGLPLRDASAQQTSGAAQKIADHFASVKTMAGEFVQFGPAANRPAASSTSAAPARSASTMTPPRRCG